MKNKEVRKFSIKFYLNTLLKPYEDGQYCVYARVVEKRVLYRFPVRLYMTEAEFNGFNGCSLQLCCFFARQGIHINRNIRISQAVELHTEFHIAGAY